MRILIVGAGIAGLTLASLLKQRGIIPDIIDKAHGFGEISYMIGLYTLGSSVFHGLGCYVCIHVKLTTQWHQIDHL